MSATDPLHFDPVWLRQKYEVEGFSTYEIGEMVGRDPKSVYRKLVAFGIPTRPRGANLVDKDNYMKSPGSINPFAGRSHTAATRAILSLKSSVPKPWLRGRGNGMSGRIGTANPNYKDGSSPERQRLYAGSEWKEFVRGIYKRDDYRCRECGDSKAGPKSLHAHHVKPWAGNPEFRFDEANVVTLCKRCHDWVHSSMNISMHWIG